MYSKRQLILVSQKKKKKKKKKTAVNGTILPQGMKQRDINSSVLKTCKSRSGL